MAIALVMILAGVVYAGALSPLTVKDISLMLRSGCSPAAVTREVSARRFLGEIDPTAEKILLSSGATSEFIEALRSGVYALPPDQAAAAANEFAAKEKLRDVQAEQARKLDAHYQSQLALKSEKKTPLPVASDSIVDLIKGGLVTSKNGIPSTFNDQAFDKKKLIALYFSAQWCPSCRKFTPTLVDYYNRVAATHPEFELLFVSRDRSAPAMEAYMRDAQMPWPAVRFDKIAEKEAVQKYAGSGIPCLVIIDSSGRVLSHSYNGKTYRGPAAVLNDLDAIFAGPGEGQVALSR